MPNKFYEHPEADEQQTPGAERSAPGVYDSSTAPRQTSYNNGSPDRSALRNAEENGDGSSLDNPNSNSVGNSTNGVGAPSSTAGSNKSASPRGLRNDEESGRRGSETGNISSTGSSTSEDSLYNPEGDNQGRLGPARSKLQNARGKAKSLTNRALKNKWLVGTIGSGGAMIIGLIILVAIIIGGYKVVDFAEHVAAYQFARTTIQMAENTAGIDAEKIGLDSIPDNTTGNKLAAALKAKYTAASSKTSDLWSRLDQYRPSKIISNYGSDGKLKFNEATTKFGRTYVKSVTINGETANLQARSLSNALRNKLIPGYRFVTRDVAFSRNFAPDLINALKADDIGPITRAKVASQIRQELNISLVAWVTARFAGKTPVDTEVAIEQDAYNVAEQGSSSTITSTGSTGATTTTTGGSPNGTLNSTAQQAQAAESAQVNDAAQVKNSILPNTNSLPDSVQTVLASLKDSAATLGGILGGIIGFINPIYKIAVPLCLVYDGSLTQSGPSIDTQNTQTVRSAIWMQSASAQLKDGNTANGQAAGAFNFKLGDITHTYAEQRASGLPVDTSSYAATEASPTGQYSIADVGLPSPMNDIVNTLGGACPTLTNLWVAAAIGGANIAISAVVGALTGGEGDVGLIGGEAAAEAAANAEVPSLATRVLAKIVNGGSALKDFGIKTGKSIVLIGGATLIAKEIVASQIGASHNTLATGQPYDDSVDCGTNIYANMVDQQQFYGMPLPDQYLGQDNIDNKAQLAYKSSQQSASQRYLAVNNADSLVSRSAIAASGYMNGSIFSSLFRLIGTLLNPVRSVGSIFGPLVSHSSFAAASVTSVNTYCGNVQFGYTPYEKSLIANDSSYKPLENQQILDASGEEDNISTKYHQCFDGSESIGTMLSNGDIQRDNNGNVILDKGLCSPKNLGTNNQDPAGPKNPSSPTGHGWGDLVFRWRVAQSYNNTLDQLTNEQTISS